MQNLHCLLGLVHIHWQTWPPGPPWPPRQPWPPGPHRQPGPPGPPRPPYQPDQLTTPTNWTTPETLNDENIYHEEKNRVHIVYLVVFIDIVIRLSKWVSWWKLKAILTKLWVRWMEWCLPWTGNRPLQNMSVSMFVFCTVCACLMARQNPCIVFACVCVTKKLLDPIGQVGQSPSPTVQRGRKPCFQGDCPGGEDQPASPADG